MRRLLGLLLFVSLSLGVKAQDTVQVMRVNEQRSFPATVPAGNYSGIAWLGGTRYAVVSDKGSSEGFFVFDIRTDSLTGDILSVSNLGFRDSGRPNRDLEGIAYVDSLKALFISGEDDNQVQGFDKEGKSLNIKFDMPHCYTKSRGNYGLESLTYSDSTSLFWTCNESTLNGDGEAATATNGVQNRLRIQSFGLDMKPRLQYAYLMDQPRAFQEAGQYAMGVSELCALPNGTLLVLEREFYVPKSKLGAFVTNKIYQVFPSRSQAIDAEKPLNASSPYMAKYPVAEWTTRLSLFSYRIANYEGMCLGPRLSDGSQLLILVSDSQGQYAGVLKDWFKTILIK